MRFPYTTARKGQLEACKRVAESLGTYIVLKAPTGFGKTIVALISHSDVSPVLYGVRTINEMSPVIRELRRSGFSFTFVYSAAKMCPLTQDSGGGRDTEDFWAACKSLRMRRMCPYFFGIDEKLDDVRELLNSESSFDPHVLTSMISSKVGVCPFFSLTRLIPDSQFVVVTYPYVFREEVFDTAFTDVGPDDFYLILDEAHTLLIPQSVVDEEIDSITVEQALKEVKQYGEHYDEVLSYLRNLLDIVSEQKGRLLKRVDKTLVLPGEGTLFLLEDALAEIRLKKLLRAPSVSDAVALSTKLSKVVKFLRYLKEPDFQSYGYLSESEVSALKALPLGYGFIKRRLSLFKGVLLMSGTMPPTHILSPICGSNLTYIDIESEYGRVFPRHNIAYIVVTSVTSSYRYRSKGMYERYARLIEAVFNTVPMGVTLVVYPSYNFMSNVLQYLVINGKQFEEGRGTKYEELLKVASTTDKVLVHCVAGGKITEGLELLDGKGRSLIKAVVVAGVPYPQPDDYARDFEKVMEGIVGSSARTYVMELPAVIKVMQAAGRAIRSEHDEAVVVLCDRRYMMPKLRELLNERYDIICRDENELVSAVRSFFEGKLLTRS